MIEVGVVIGLDFRPRYWHLPPGRTAGSIPDTRSLWDVLWEQRADVAGFAHSHPGSGVPGPSHTDVTTFAAIEAGLNGGGSGVALGLVGVAALVAAVFAAKSFGGGKRRHSFTR